MKNQKKKQIKISPAKQLDRIKSKAKDEQTREANYIKYKHRPDDWLIGKAHCELGGTNDDPGLVGIGETLGAHKRKLLILPIQIIIGENLNNVRKIGKNYAGKKYTTKQTFRFFWNCFVNTERYQQFERKVQQMIHEEAIASKKSLSHILELIGVQDNDEIIKRYYPQKRQNEIKKEIWQEIKNVLDKYSDSEFKKLEPSSLYHSSHILRNYLKENRPKLLINKKDV